MPNSFLMYEDDNIPNQNPDGNDKQELKLAVVSAVNTENTAVTLLLDGTDTQTQKYYKVLSSAWPLEQGDRVIVLKMSGTYVVIGKIGAGDDPDPDPPTDILPIANGGTGDSGIVYETTIANIITPRSGVNISIAYFVKWGKVAQLQVYFTLSSAETFANIGNVVAEKRPKITAYGSTSGSPGGPTMLFTTGDIYVYGTFSANTRYAMGLTYLLP